LISKFSTQGPSVLQILTHKILKSIHQLET